MTKEKFSKVYDLFTTLVKQEVNEQYVMNASCRFIDYCGGYRLDIRPSCLMWGSELALLSALCDRLSISMEVYFDDGRISIY